MNGILIINKPLGITSHDVVNRARRILRQRSIGHMGTLDPFATGVLPLLVGNMTRLARFYACAEKTYEGAIRFGFATATFDCEGERVGEAKTVNVSLSEVRELSRSFLGVIDQTPPPFSAKKINGVRAYKLAREGREVTLKPAQVEIKRFEILSAQGDLATFRARVASGTYMRSVAHDLGKKMGCGAHLETLYRASVAEFGLEDVHTLEQLQFAAESGNTEQMFVHPRKLLPGFPAVTTDDDTVARIRSGRTVNLPEFSAARLVKVFRGQSELIAIATRIAGTLFHAKTVLAAESA